MNTVQVERVTLAVVLVTLHFHCKDLVSVT